MKPSLRLNSRFSVPLSEIQFIGIRAQGPGGQHLNKVSTAVHLRFDIRASSLPEMYKARLLALTDRRMSKSGVIVIKAGRFRTREQNQQDALERLREILQGVARVPTPRKTTRPTRASQTRRLERKARRGRLKHSRSKVGLYE